MIYYLYHIPGKKIGVTCDLNNRVTLVQGYKEGEYEVLEQSEDIDYISDREIELQQSYGYKKDRPEIIDAIGDMVVVLTNLAHQEGFDIESCIDSAYNVINKRTGKMINGTFVKDAD
jgi:hypothetical protein